MFENFLGDIVLSGILSCTVFEFQEIIWIVSPRKSNFSVHLDSVPLSRTVAILDSPVIVRLIFAWGLLSNVNDRKNKNSKIPLGNHLCLVWISDQLVSWKILLCSTWWSFRNYINFFVSSLLLAYFLYYDQLKFQNNWSHFICRTYFCPRI